MSESTALAEVATVEIGEAVFCKPHYLELCSDCDFDGREENDAYFSFDSIDREALVAPKELQLKDGVYQCKKHSSATCNTCFGWKKAIQKRQKDAKKAGKKEDGWIQPVLRLYA